MVGWNTRDLKELSDQSKGRQGTKAQLEIVHAERVWCDFFDEPDEDLTEFLIDMDVENWATLQLNEFRRRVSEVMSQ
jgi:hypothetical protein